MMMKKISCVAVMMVAFGTTCAGAAYDAGKFRGEVLEGLDIISARTVGYVAPVAAPGELGNEVYEYAGEVAPDDIQMYIPTSMYVRMGGGLNLGFATDAAMFDGVEYDASGGYATQIGLGWNLSSYVRTELDFQNSVLEFSDLDGRRATYNTIGGHLYFDLARRYVQTGDITRRRTFVPFIGVGASIGCYEFQGTGGADGFVIAAPRATVGFNVMFTDLIGIDIAYQYQMMIGHGYGWGVRDGGVDNISNIMATFRMNF